MIKYNLECEYGHVYESWFLSSTEYETLIKKKLINCVQCNSTVVRKTLMTPNLSGKSNKVKKNNKFEKIVRKELVKFRNYIEKNCKDVGDNFPQEARSIHYDKKTSKGIYGKATPRETAELLEEGIEVSTVPWADKTEN